MCLIPVLSLENNFHKHMWFPSLKTNSLGNKKCKAVDLSSIFSSFESTCSFEEAQFINFLLGHFFFLWENFSKLSYIK